jgi:hypothetical protein
MDALQDECLMLPKKEFGDIEPALNCYAANVVEGAMKELA